MMRKLLCNVCQDNLAPGTSCSACGGRRATPEESASVLYRALGVQRSYHEVGPFFHVSDKFRNDATQLRAMICIRDIVFFCELHRGGEGGEELKKWVSQIEAGGLPTDILEKVRSYYLGRNSS